MADKIQQVQVITTTHNDYATIIRSCLTAANACKRLLKMEHPDPKAERNLRAILALKDWADENYKRAII